MTAATKTSNNKSSFFAIRFRSKLTESRRLFIINMVFQLLLLPVLAVSVMQVFNHRDITSREDLISYGRSVFNPYILIAEVSFFLSLTLAVIIPMMNFRYLYSKTYADMNYSLPLNNRQRFLADYFSGLVLFIAPVLTGAAVASISLFIGSRFINLLLLRWYIPYAVRIGCVVLLGLILLYTFSVFAIVMTGSFFEALFSVVALNSLLPAVVMLTWMNIVISAHYGVSSESMFHNHTLFTTSPFGAFAFVMDYADLIKTDLSYSSAYMNAFYYSFIIGILLFTLLIFAASYLLYKHRKAEDVSAPYVYKAFYYFLMVLVVYSIFSISRYAQFSGFIASIVISCIIWFIMEVIRRRGFRRFWTAIAGFAAVCGSVICIFKVIDVTDGLGYVKKLPSASSVSDVYVDTYGVIDGYNLGVLLNSSDIINDAIELNQEIVDRHYSSDNYEVSDFVFDNEGEWKKLINNKRPIFDEENTIRFIYCTRSGQRVYRTYNVPSELLTKLICNVYTDEEYAEQIKDELYRNSLTYDDEDESYDSTKKRKICRFRFTDKIGNDINRSFSLADGKELTWAIRNDIAAMEPDDLKNSEYYCNIENQIITSAFTNTIKFLEKQHVNYYDSGKDLLNEFDNYSEVMRIDCDVEYLFPLLYYDVNFTEVYRLKDTDYIDHIRPERYQKNEKLDTILSLSCNRDRAKIGLVGKHTVFADPEAAAELLDIASPIVINEKVIAEVNTGKTTLYVTDRPGNREIVEKVKDTIEIHDNTDDEYLYNVNDFDF